MELQSYILLEGSRAEMLVHKVCSFQKFFEVVESHIEGNGEADGGPEGVPPPHPVPEPEHVGLVNAEALDFGGVGGEGHKMLRYEGLLKS